MDLRVSEGFSNLNDSTSSGKAEGQVRPWFAALWIPELSLGWISAEFLQFPSKASVFLQLIHTSSLAADTATALPLPDPVQGQVPHAGTSRIIPSGYQATSTCVLFWAGYFCGHLLFHFPQIIIQQSPEQLINPKQWLKYS